MQIVKNGIFKGVPEWFRCDICYSHAHSLVSGEQLKIDGIDLSVAIGICRDCYQKMLENKSLSTSKVKE